MHPRRILSSGLAGAGTSLLVALSLSGAAAGSFVSPDRIKVFLFAAPAFWQEVAIDAYKNVCIDLDNNLYVISPLVIFRCDPLPWFVVDGEWRW